MQILSLGEKVKKRRKQLNMTLKELAKDRITPGQISLVESGKSNPSMDLLEYLSCKLSMPIEYLIESEKSQAKKICIYYENITDYYISCNNINKAQENNETALFYCKEYKLECNMAVNLSKKAYIHVLKEEYQEAQSLYMNANNIFIGLRKMEDSVRIYIKIGEISMKLESYHSAISYIKQGEKTYLDNNFNDPSLLGSIYYYLAVLYYRVENIDKSIRYSFLAKEKLNQVIDKRKYADNLALLAEQYAVKGDVRSAVKYSNQTRNVLLELNELFDLARFENGLGNIFSKLENYEESFIHLNKAMEIRENVCDDKLIETLLLKSNNYIKIGNIKKAKENSKKIYEHLHQTQRDYIIEYYILEFELNMLEKDFSKAENFLSLALKHAEELNNLEKVSEVAIMFGAFYKTQGDYVKASEYLNKGIAVLKEMGIIKQ